MLNKQSQFPKIETAADVLVLRSDELVSLIAICGYEGGLESATSQSNKNRDHSLLNAEDMAAIVGP